MSFDEILLYFVLYSVLGFLLEAAYRSLAVRRPVWPGFLYGPWCPIYGFGLLLVALVLEPLKGSLPLYFLGAVALTTLLEYVTGVLFDRLLGTRLWDYSDKPFNFQGLVALEFSLYWGVLALLFGYGLHPLTVRLADLLAGTGVLPFLKYVFVPVLLGDTLLSVNKAVRLRSHLSALDLIAREIDEFREEAGEKLEELKERFESRLKAAIRSNKHLLVTSDPTLASRRFPKAVRALGEAVRAARRGKKEK